MRLYHATRSCDAAARITASGFVGNRVWGYSDVVFFASRPLRGFGGWRECWIEIDVPEDVAIAYEDPHDSEAYGCRVFALPAAVANQYERVLHYDSVSEFERIPVTLSCGCWAERDPELYPGSLCWVAVGDEADCPVHGVVTIATIDHPAWP